MITISARQALKTLMQTQDALSRSNISTIMSRALNETILQGRTEGRRMVKEIYNMPQRYMSAIDVHRSTPLTLTSDLFGSTKPIPMDAFSPRFQTVSTGIRITRKGEQKTKSYKRKKNNPVIGVSIEVLKGKREIVPFAFLIPGGKSRVFARGEYKSGTSFGFTQRHSRVQQSGSDTPIKPLISVTVHAAMINKQSMQKISDKVNDVLPRSIEKNLKHLLDGIGASELPG